MTDQDEDAAIGQLVKRATAARRRRAALLGRVDAARAVLERVVAELRALDGFQATAHPVPALPPDYPERQALDAALRELDEVNRDIERTRQLLKDAGISNA